METLVLNASFEIMKIVPWQRAITWWFLDKVDVIEEYDQFIGTINAIIRVPAVVKYKVLIKPRHQLLRFSKSNVYTRDQNYCQYCGRQFLRRDLTIDHILPQSRGGISSWNNCVACCIDCNITKANNTPKEAGMKLLREPKQPTRSELLLLMLKLRSTTFPAIWNSYYV